MEQNADYERLVADLCRIENELRTLGEGVIANRVEWAAAGLSVRLRPSPFTTNPDMALYGLPTHIDSSGAPP